MTLSISIITPSFNQAIFLSQCLESVANQSYPALEHFVYDPGSKDHSRDIARSFSHVTLIAEPDKGQSDAVSKGFLAAKGDIIGWLNSDDCYANPDIFDHVIQRFQQPDLPDIVYGRGVYVDDKGKYLRDAYVNESPETLEWKLHKEVGILQPALFLRRSVIEKIGVLSNALNFCMDYEYWIRAVKAGLKFAFLPEVVAFARYYKDNKTLGKRGESLREICDTVKSHFGYVHVQWIRNYAEFLSEGFDGILANSSNQKVTNQDAIDYHTKRLLKAYNTDFYTLKLLIKNSNNRPYNLTVEAMKNHKIGLDFFYHEIPVEQKTEPNCYCYTVGDKRWAFSRQWKDTQIEKTKKTFEKFRAERVKDTCIIVGNGPSLNKTDLSLLENQDVFISNYAFLNQNLIKYAKYIAVTNYLVAEQGSYQFNLLDNIKKLFPYWLGYCINEDENTFFFNSVGYAEFSKDINTNVSWRSTVSFFQMQIAYGLGYKRVLLIGFDHSYDQKSSAKEGDILLCDEDDKNHFDPRYFKGKLWQAADVDNMEAMYLLTKQAFEESGREIINCTVGGHLEVFYRGDLKSYLIERSNIVNNSHNISNEPVSSDDYIKQADILIKQKKWGEAINLYKRGVVLNPEQPGFIYENLGEALMHYNRNLPSDISLTETREKLNYSFDSYFESANLLMKQEKWDEAIDFYKQGIELHPKQPSLIYERLGESLIGKEQSYPRLLIIDWTKIGSISATGQIKKNLFADWPEDKFLQVFCKSHQEFGLYFKDSSSIKEQYFINVQDILQKCDEFKPDLIYYRPVADHLQFHNLACQLIERLQIPVVTHIMDDWMKRLQEEQSLTYEKLDTSIRSLFKQSSACLSISDVMSNAFKKRYDENFIPIMNCIDVETWFRQRDKINSRKNSKNKTFTIRYVGALADDMNFSSISDVVNAISYLHKNNLAVEMEIYTMPYWKKKAIDAFSNLPGIKIRESNFSQHDYRNILMTANALVVAYNFDQESINYVRYSIANKLPECLASGVPVLVYGPNEVGTVSYVATTNAVELITKRDKNQLLSAVKKLVENPKYCKELGQRGCEFVHEHHNAEIVRQKFYTILKTAALQSYKNV
jgi:glycosyltransferase involved in cell wall biosynthesis